MVFCLRPVFVLFKPLAGNCGVSTQARPLSALFFEKRLPRIDGASLVLAD